MDEILFVDDLLYCSFTRCIVSMHLLESLGSGQIAIGSHGGSHCDRWIALGIKGGFPGTGCEKM